MTEYPIGSIPPEDDEEWGHWISPGAAKRIRRLTFAIGVMIVLLGLVAWIAIDARKSTQEEQDARIASNTQAIVTACQNLNLLTSKVKAIIASQGTVVEPIDAASLGFVDPAVTRYVQGIIDRSAANARVLHEQGEGVRLINCVELSKHPPGVGETVPTLPVGPSSTTTSTTSLFRR